MRRRKQRRKLEQYGPFLYFIISGVFCYMLYTFSHTYDYFLNQEWLIEQPSISVRAMTSSPETPQYTQKQEIMFYIVEVFGDKANEAMKIVECESGFDTERIGDEHLMGELNGVQIGDSVGLFQIRTGDAGVYDGKPWNRAEANGMSVEEFRTKMKNFNHNVDYAKQIYERAGKSWSPWFNCMKKTNLH